MRNFISWYKEHRDSYGMIWGTVATALSAITFICFVLGLLQSLVPTLFILCLITSVITYLFRGIKSLFACSFWASQIGMIFIFPLFIIAVPICFIVAFIVMFFFPLVFVFVDKETARDDEAIENVKRNSKEYKTEIIERTLMPYEIDSYMEQIKNNYLSDFDKELEPVNVSLLRSCLEAIGIFGVYGELDEDGKIEPFMNYHGMYAESINYPPEHFTAGGFVSFELAKNGIISSPSILVRDLILYEGESVDWEHRKPGDVIVTSKEEIANDLLDYLLDAEIYLGKFDIGNGVLDYSASCGIRLEDRSKVCGIMSHICETTKPDAYPMHLMKRF